MNKETYTVESVVRALNKLPGISIKGTTIRTLETITIGTKTWGKIDFLRKNGYNRMVVSSMGNNKVDRDIKEDIEEHRRRKKKKIDTLSEVKEIMKQSNFKVKK